MRASAPLEKWVSRPFLAEGGGGAVAGEQDGAVGQRTEDFPKSAERVLIECGGLATADGACKKSISCDEDRCSQAIDMETERRCAVTG